MRPHRGRLCLALGVACIFDVVLGTLVCMLTDSLAAFIGGAALILGSIPPGLVVLVIGRRDARAMKRGEMDPSGRRPTRIGAICGACGAALALSSALFLGWVIHMISGLA
jgi:hypothetical protein